MMKDKSSLGPVEYIAECVFWGLISMIWYKNILFRCLENHSYTESRLFLWGLIALYIVVCRFLAFKKTRTYWTLIIALVLPYGIYTILSYKNTLGSMIMCILLVASLISLVSAVLILARKVKNPAKKKQIIRRRLYRCFVRTSSVFAVGMIIIMFPMLLHGAFGATLFKSNVRATTENTKQEQTISNNIDTILKLQESEWVKLSTLEKLDVIQTVANIEAHYLDLPSELNVGTANLPEYTLAAYSDATHTIYINLSHLENDQATDVLDSCCHEAYHAYQHRLVDAYNSAPESSKHLKVYKKAALYVDEFNNYVDGYEDFCSYYFQECESDAREYADEAVEDYLYRIYEFLENDATE